MPLDRLDEASAGQLHGFDDTVRRGSQDGEAGRQIPDPLMVEAVDENLLLPEQLPQGSALLPDSGDRYYSTPLFTE